MTIDGLLRDGRYALRTLIRTPATSGLILLVLGVALAGNIVLFSVIDTALFKPLALPGADRLVNVYTVRRDAGYGGLSYPDYVDLSAALTSSGACEAVFGYGGLMASLTIGDDRPEMVFGEIVTANYFSAARVPLALGAADLAATDAPAQPPHIVIGHRFWQRRFNGDPSVLNRMVRLNGMPFTVRGVAAPEFGGLLFNGLSADVWVPMSQLERIRGDVRFDRGERWLFVKAALRDPDGLSQAAAIAEVVAERLRAAHGATNQDRSFGLLRTSDVMVNPEADPALRPVAIALIVLGALVLAIAAANIAGVLLARMSLRQRDLAVRVSLGATRGRLTAALAAEAAILSAGTLAIGLALSWVALRALGSWQPGLPVPLGWTFGLDRRVILFAVAVTLVTMTLVAMLPAWRSTRVPPLTALRGSAASSRRRVFTRESLLIPQVALSLVLLVVAGLLTRSLQQATHLDLGFTTERTAVLAINLGLSGYDEPRARRFWASLVDRVRADAGVRAAAITDRIPLDLYGSQSTVVRVSETAAPVPMQLARVGEQYFETLGIPRLAGRTFAPADMQTADAVIVSRSAASELWPGQHAIGRTLRLGDRDGWRTVVGVVDDVQLLESLGESGSPLLYEPLARDHTRVMRIVAAAHPGADDLEPRLIAAARAVDPAVAVFETRSFRDHISTMLLPFRAAAWTALAAGLFGLLLTLAGIAGSVLQMAAARSREIGIRVALGGSRRHVARAVAGRAAAATLAGIAVGLLASVGAARGLGAFLFGITPLDPLTLAVVPGGFVLVVLLASIAPLRRAFRQDPAVVLRED
jgi:predicted permease